MAGLSFLTDALFGSSKPQRITAQRVDAEAAKRAAMQAGQVQGEQLASQQYGAAAQRGASPLAMREAMRNTALGKQSIAGNVVQQSTLAEQRAMDINAQMAMQAEMANVGAANAAAQQERGAQGQLLGTIAGGVGGFMLGGPAGAVGGAQIGGAALSDENAKRAAFAAGANSLTAAIQAKEQAMTPAAPGAPAAPAPAAPGVPRQVVSGVDKFGRPLKGYAPIPGAAPPSPERYAYELPAAPQERWQPQQAAVPTSMRARSQGIQRELSGDIENDPMARAGYGEAARTQAVQEALSARAEEQEGYDPQGRFGRIATADYSNPDMPPTLGAADQGRYDAADADQWAVSDERAKMMARAMKPREFAYKPEYQAEGGTGPNLGIYAQDLERVPEGRTMVQRGPDGMRRVDTAKLALANAAMLGSQQRQIDELQPGTVPAGGMKPHGSRTKKGGGRRAAVVKMWQQGYDDPEVILDYMNHDARGKKIDNYTLDEVKRHLQSRQETAL